MATIRGTSSSNVLRGTSASDRLFGFNGNDRLFGRNGHDLLYGGNHNDLLFGDSGNDRLWGQNGNDRLFGGHGNDRLYGQNGLDFLRGQNGHDLLYGGNHNDRLYGGDGVDRLYGQNHHDWLYGGNHNDRLYGGDGVDRLYGENHHDWLYGGNHNDRLYGGNHNDRLYGQNHHDWLYGGNHNDRLFGQQGNDRLYGQNHNDWLYGGSGNDLLVGGSGIDLLEGGPGDDIYIVDHVDEIVEPTLDEGYDEVRASVSFVLGVHQEKLVLLGDDDIDGDATVHGHDRDNVVIGNPGDNILLTGSGNDRIEGGAGDDIISAGGGAWVDEMFGGPGDDTFFFNRFDTIDGGPGTDAVVLIHFRVSELTAHSIEVIDQRQATYDQVFDTAPLSLTYPTSLPDAAQLAAWNPDSTILVRGDEGDIISGPGSWTLTGEGIFDGVPVRTFTDSGTTLHVEQGVDVAFSSILDFSPEQADYDGSIDGLGGGDRLGKSLDGGADINGDGFDDVILGAPGANGGAGAAYVLFGGAGFNPATVDLAALDGSNGIRLDGVGAGDAAGASVSLAGDVNGDGLVDILVAAPGADHNGADTGSAYVVFGSTDFSGATLDLGALDGTNGFRVDGSATGELSSAAVGRVGDLNGDGYDDIGIGAAQLVHTPGEKGTTFIVFGTGSGHAASMTLAGLDGNTGFRVDDTNRAGAVLSGGDLNGDGIDDLVVGSPLVGGAYSQSAYAIFGNAGGFGARLHTADLDGSNGFAVRVPGSAQGVSASGDVNADGLADFLIGHTANQHTTPLGGFRMLYGSEDAFPSLFDTHDLDGDNGFRTWQSFDTEQSNLGSTVDFLGDINGDGYDDYGVSSGSDVFRPHGGEYSVILFGGETPHPDRSFRPTPGVIENNFAGGLEGLRITRYEEMKLTIAGAGDLNGDGYNDVLFADNDALVNGNADTGAVFVLLGRDFGYGVDIEGTTAGESLTGTAANERLLAAAGDDVLDGGGGIDILLAGPGDDILIFDANDRRADGGNGVDTLRLDGSGIALDFDALDALLVTGIDRIDLSGSGDNSVSLSLADVMQISDFDFLRLDGDAGDAVTSTGQGWQVVPGGPVTLDGVSYDAWAVNGINLLIDTDLTTSIS